MRDLEQLITTAKNMMIYGMSSKDIFKDLEKRGWHHDLIHWAIRGAEFELKFQEDLSNA